MNTSMMLASQLKINDTVLTETGNPVTIKRITKGFWPNSILITWGSGGGMWSCVRLTDSIAIVDTVKIIDPVL